MKIINNDTIQLIKFSEKFLNDPAYISWLQDYNVIKTLNRPEYSKKVEFKDLENYVKLLLKSNTNIFWAICLKEKEKFIGTLKVSKINYYSKTSDLGIMIGDKNEWGKGYAQQSLKLAGNYLFSQLSMRKLTSGVMSINTPMIKVFKNLGFKQEGVIREQDFFENKYYDHIHYGCFKNEFSF